MPPDPATNPPTNPQPNVVPNPREWCRSASRDERRNHPLPARAESVRLRGCAVVPDAAAYPDWLWSSPRRDIERHGLQLHRPTHSPARSGPQSTGSFSGHTAPPHPVTAPQRSAAHGRAGHKRTGADAVLSAAARHARAHRGSDGYSVNGCGPNDDGRGGRPPQQQSSPLPRGCCHALGPTSVGITASGQAEASFPA